MSDPSTRLSDYISDLVGMVEQHVKQINETEAAYKEGRKVPQSERIGYDHGRSMPATVMFIDISGFSSLQSENAEQQKALAPVLGIFFRAVGRVISDYGGHIEKHTGDGLMTYFVDSEHSDKNSTQRALESALTCFSVTDEIINPLLHRSGHRMIDYRFALDHGQITIAKLGSPRRFDQMVAIGTTANIASKMLKFVGPNEIALGDSAYRRIHSEWAVKFALPIPTASGWLYTATETPYTFYRYKGRWIK